jgi:uroporphyrinogen-III decarboxylase
VIGIDWRIDLDEAWARVGHDRAVQGNLDPVVLLADRDTVRRRAREVLARAGGRPGHIFNLGHGVLPQTPVENVLELIAAVKGG